MSNIHRIHDLDELAAEGWTPGGSFVGDNRQLLLDEIRRILQMRLAALEDRLIVVHEGYVIILGDANYRPIIHHWVESGYDLYDVEWPAERFIPPTD